METVRYSACTAMNSEFLIPVFVWGERNNLDQNQRIKPNKRNVHVLSLEIHRIAILILAFPVFQRMA